MRNEGGRALALGAGQQGQAVVGAVHGGIQGQGALVGATLGELPVPQAVAAMTTGEIDPAQAAKQADEAVTELQNSLR